MMSTVYKKRICTDVMAKCPSQQGQRTCQQHSRGKKKRDPKRIMFKRALILYIEKLLQYFLVFPFTFSSPFPSLLVSRLKKGFHGCQEVLASCTSLWGCRDRSCHIVLPLYFSHVSHWKFSRCGNVVAPESLYSGSTKMFRCYSLTRVLFGPHWV